MRYSSAAARAAPTSRPLGGIADGALYWAVAPVAVGVRSRLLENKTPLDRVRFHHFPAYEPWCRDHGPIFLVRDQDGKHELYQAGVIPQLGEHFGAAAFLLTGALRKVRGAHLLPMPGGHLEMMHAGLGIVGPTPARFRKGALVLLAQRL